MTLSQLVFCLDIQSIKKQSAKGEHALQADQMLNVQILHEVLWILNNLVTADGSNVDIMLV